MAGTGAELQARVEALTAEEAAGAEVLARAAAEAEAAERCFAAAERRLAAEKERVARSRQELAEAKRQLALLRAQFLSERMKTPASPAGAPAAEKRKRGRTGRPVEWTKPALKEALRRTAARAGVPVTELSTGKYTELVKADPGLGPRSRTPFRDHWGRWAKALEAAAPPAAEQVKQVKADVETGQGAAAVKEEEEEVKISSLLEMAVKDEPEDVKIRTLDCGVCNLRACNLCAITLEGVTEAGSG